MIYEHCRIMVLKTVKEGLRERTFQVFGSAKQNVEEDELIFIHHLSMKQWELVSYVRNYIILVDDTAKEEVYILRRINAN